MSDNTEYCPICEEELCKHGLCKDTGNPWTDGCPGSQGKDGYQCQDCAEAAEQRWIEDYYGGDGPMTDREREEVERNQR
jgi:hypothetical protein